MIQSSLSLSEESEEMTKGPIVLAAGNSLQTAVFEWNVRMGIEEDPRRK
jgi:hypothetical protein